MKKTSHTLVVIVVLVIVAIILGVGLVSLQQKKGAQTIVATPDIFHTLQFPLEPRFFSNQLVVLTSENQLAFYDTASQKLTPHNFPAELFDSIYHFSFSPAKDKAFIIGSKDENGMAIVKYALVDFQNYQFTWFDEQVVSRAVGAGYRISDITMDSAGREFLFILTPEQEVEATNQQYRLIVINPLTQAIREIQTLTGKNVSMQYYDSTKNVVAYNKEVADEEVGMIVNLGNRNEQTIPRIMSLSTFANDVVFGSYTARNQLAFSSIAAPDTVRLTIDPDPTYTLLSPYVARSITGRFTAYHVWKSVAREGIVRIAQTDGKVVFDQPVKGSVEMFFSPDDTKMLIVAEQADSQGMKQRQGFLVDLVMFKSSSISLPKAISSIIEWY